MTTEECHDWYGHGPRRGQVLDYHDWFRMDDGDDKQIDRCRRCYTERDVPTQRLLINNPKCVSCGEYLGMFDKDTCGSCGLQIETDE